VFGRGLAEGDVADMDAVERLDGEAAGSVTRAGVVADEIGLSAMAGGVADLDEVRDLVVVDPGEVAALITFGAGAQADETPFERRTGAHRSPPAPMRSSPSRRPITSTSWYCPRL